MPIVTLRDLYIAELHGLYDAEQQVLREMPELAAKTTSAILRKALDDHLERTRVQLERLDLLFQQLGVAPGGHQCEGVRGLIMEARRRVSETERGEVLDAAIIGAAQRIEHYEMAAYGCARAYAETLGDAEGERVLQQTLEEEGKADHRLSAIAERGVNREAADDEAGSDVRLQSRLRYVANTDLPEFHYREFRILHRNGDDLGSLDGFIVESTSGRPLYCVVDSGGWLAGRRYLVPVGMLEPDEAHRALRTSLDRRTIHRYPPFSPSAFLAMDDYEARRYERRLLAVVAPERARTGRWPRPTYDDIPEYRPPTWLMTGVWMTEAAGFAAVPPRAHSDLERIPEHGSGSPATREPSRAHDESPEAELAIARGERDEPRDPEGGQRSASETGRGRDTEMPKTTDPRIERYRER